MSSSRRRERLRRPIDDRVIGGVCAAIARRVDLDPLLVRVAAVLLAIGTGGAGIVAYFVGLVMIPSERRNGNPDRAPSRRTGRRSPGSWLIATGLGLIVLSVLLSFRELGVWWSDAIVWPLVLAVSGGFLLWAILRPVPETAPAAGWAGGGAAPAAEPGTAPTLEVPTAGQQAGRLSLLGFGIALVVGAALLFLWINGSFKGASNVALAALVLIVSLVLILAPLLMRVARNQASERAERIRSQERAEMGAHLHDSVLQTLALVQAKAEDPREVATLARRQERELRSWLSGDEPARPDERLADALRAAAAEVEEAHGAPIEVVVVGDIGLDERTEALVAATREALTNAAKFAPDGHIRLYAEIDPERAQVFVHDRGPGFDPREVPSDRRGIRESIIGRMQRHGGLASVRSRHGEVTEVELKMELKR